eukprot:297920-Chlamydomonas_euryale.AAC.4
MSWILAAHAHGHTCHSPHLPHLPRVTDWQPPKLASTAVNAVPHLPNLPHPANPTWFASSTVEGRCCTKCHMMAPISPLVVGAHAVVSGSMPGTIKSVCGFPSAVT